MIESQEMLIGYEDLGQKSDFNEVMKKHFLKVKEIKELESIIVTLDRNIEKIRSDIKLTNITIDPFPSVSGSDSIGGGNGGYNTESYIEKNMISGIEKLESLLMKSINKKLKFSAKKDELKLDVMDIEIFLQMLSYESKEILKMKFFDNNTNVEISIKLNMGESTVRKKIGEIEELYNTFLYNS